MYQYDVIPIVINSNHTRFFLSKKIRIEYEKTTNKIIRDMRDINLRSDPVLINIIKKYKREASLEIDSLTIWLIPRFMEKYVQIDEYDGLETISLLCDKYKIDSINKINNSDFICPEKKKKIINKIINMVIPDPKKIRND